MVMMWLVLLGRVFDFLKAVISKNTIHYCFIVKRIEASSQLTTFQKALI